MKNPKVSIILPTYNVVQYINQCLESINKQTYSNYEVIIVIDGATDGSYEVAKKYCESHERFFVYWQDNAGSGSARNMGLDHAVGELVFFVDPDDWLELNYIERMVYEQLNSDYDLVTTLGVDHYFDSNGNEIKVHHQNIIPNSVFGEKEVRKVYLDLFCKCFLHAPHSRVYKKSIIDKYRIRFPELRRSQDIVFNYRYYDKIQNLRVTDYAGYNYRVLYKDRVARRNSDYYKTVAFIYEEIIDLHKKWGIAIDKSLLATNLFINVYTSLQTRVLKKESTKSLYDDRIIMEIVENAHPKEKHLMLLKHLMRIKMQILSEWLVRIIIKLK